VSDDPLDDLAAAWRKLDPPSPHPDEDALTRATVEWLRGAWNALEAPTLELPVVQSAALRDQPRRTLRLLPLAAAVAAGWLLFVFWLARPAAESANEIAKAPEQDLPAMHAIRRDDGSFELRSGVVRLVLLDQPPITTDPNPEPRTTGDDR